MNTPGPDQKRLPPHAVKRGNIGGESHNSRGQSVERRKPHGGRMQNFSGFRAPRSGGQHGLSNSLWIAHPTKHGFGLRVVGNNTRRTPAVDSSHTHNARAYHR